MEIKRIRQCEVRSSSKVSFFPDTLKIKSVSYSSQGSHTGQLDFCNWDTYTKKFKHLISQRNLPKVYIFTSLPLPHSHWEATLRVCFAQRKINDDFLTVTPTNARVSYQWHHHRHVWLNWRRNSVSYTIRMWRKRMIVHSFCNLNVTILSINSHARPISRMVLPSDLCIHNECSRLLSPVTGFYLFPDPRRRRRRRRRRKRRRDVRTCMHFIHRL